MNEIVHTHKFQTEDRGYQKFGIIDKLTHFSHIEMQALRPIFSI